MKIYHNTLDQYWLYIKADGTYLINIPRCAAIVMSEKEGIVITEVDSVSSLCCNSYSF